MTKCTDCLIFCATSITYTKYSYFLRLLTIFSLHFPCPIRPCSELCYSHALTDAPLASPCLLHTLPLTHVLICSTRYYNIMSVVELSKFPPLPQELIQRVFSWISRFSSSYQRTRTVSNIEWFMKNNIRFLFNGPMIF